MLITDIALKNRTTVFVLIFAITVAGTYSYITLPREAAPDVPIPLILINTDYRGVSPEDVESAVTIKIEKELAGLKGLKEVRSSSSEGHSSIVCEFHPDVKVDDAMQYVRDRLDRAKGELPKNDDLEEPSLQEINIAEFPFLIINISGEISPVRMKAIADELEDAIEQVPGVLGVDVSGVLEREIRLEIDQERVAAYNLTLAEVLALVPSENVNISAGGLETEGTKFNVRVPAEFVDPSEADKLLLAVRDGKPIYLSDVARVRDTFKDRVAYSRLDGAESVTLGVKKRIGANIVHIADAVRYILDEFRKQAPAGVRFTLTFDQSKDIRLMVADLENNILSGLVLVVGVLIIFMGLRTSLIVSLVIPLSMLISFFLIQTLGYTLNMVVLFSLILALGMLVDNAIVIVENIYRHRAQLGYSALEAAALGSREVAWPVTTSTLTTVAAFAPLLFWPGIMGDFMKYLPIVLIITLSSSLFVALIINPVISAMFIGDHGRGRRSGRFMRGYRGLLRLAVDCRYVTLALASLLLIGLAVAYAKWGRGLEFFPEMDPDQAAVKVRFPQGANVRDTDRMARLIERRVEKYRADLDHVVTQTGGGDANIFGEQFESAGPHYAKITLVFSEFEVRRRPAESVVHELRRDLDDLAGAEISVVKAEHGPPTGAAVTLRVIGKDFSDLEPLSRQVKQRIQDVPNLVNLRTDHEAARPELNFIVDRRRAMLLGVNTAIVGNFLKTAILGSRVGAYREFKDEYDITVRLPVNQRVNVEDLLALRVPNNRGEAVPLSSLGSFRYKGGFGVINHVNQKRVITVLGDAEGRSGAEVLQDVRFRLKDLSLPPGCEIRYAGEDEEMNKATAFLSKAFVIACLLIAMILVAQFNGLGVPFNIMTTVILSLVGVFVGLLVCDMRFGVIMTGIGVISLAGVVVNNAIVLLDYTRQLQARGMDLIEAVVEAGATRLRPVLLTAGTTVLGLVPMALGVSYDFHTFTWATRSKMSQFWSSMSVAVIFGLSFATVLTLVVCPSLYVMFCEISAVLGFGQGAHRPRAASAQESAAENA